MKVLIIKFNPLSNNSFITLDTDIYKNEFEECNLLFSPKLVSNNTFFVDC